MLHTNESTKSQSDMNISVLLPFSEEETTNVHKGKRVCPMIVIMDYITKVMGPRADY